ncbi:hypothetical protein LSAT2_032020 [Lamellibrachia satsuma]|nr:hypothetical protein LSAT2_032020 [Lamellibrachia satsuma]
MASALLQRVAVTARALRATASWRTSCVRHLPVCSVDTNMQRSAVPANFNKDLAYLIGTVFKKSPESIFMILRTDVEMLRYGTDQPTAVIHLSAIGVFDEQRNPAYAKALLEFIVSQLKIPDTRVGLVFHDITKNDAGHLLYQEMKTAK